MIIVNGENINIEINNGIDLKVSGNVTEMEISQPEINVVVNGAKGNNGVAPERKFLSLSVNNTSQTASIIYNNTGYNYSFTFAGNRIRIFITAGSFVPIADGGLYVIQTFNNISNVEQITITSTLIQFILNSEFEYNAIIEFINVF